MSNSVFALVPGAGSSLGVNVGGNVVPGGQPISASIAANPQLTPASQANIAAPGAGPSASHLGGGAPATREDVQNLANAVGQGFATTVNHVQAGITTHQQQVRQAEWTRYFGKPLQTLQYKECKRLSQSKLRQCLLDCQPDFPAFFGVTVDQFMTTHRSNIKEFLRRQTGESTRRLKSAIALKFKEPHYRAISKESLIAYRNECAGEASLRALAKKMFGLRAPADANERQWKHAAYALDCWSRGLPVVMPRHNAVIADDGIPSVVGAPLDMNALAQAHFNVPDSDEEE